jgi:nucleotide-binding universal stress UspA family protein
MYQRILVPVDGGATAAGGLDQAIRLANLTGATLCLVHMLDAASHCSGFETGAVYCSEVLPRVRQTGERILDESRQRVERAGLKAETVLFEASGGVSEFVLDYAKRWGAELIVVGTHGRRGAARFFMGSDAERILRGATVPVLLVRPVAPVGSGADGEPADAVSRTPAVAHG